MRCLLLQKSENSTTLPHFLHPLHLTQSYLPGMTTVQRQTSHHQVTQFSVHSDDVDRYDAIERRHAEIVSIRGLPAGGNVPNLRGRLENYTPKTRELNSTRINREFNNENRADAINELKADMAALKNSVSYLIALSTKPKSEPSNSGDPPRKRAYRDAFGKSLSGHTTPPRRHSPCIAAGSEAHPTFPFSAYEARNLIQEELGRIPRSSTSKHEAFRCALSSLKQNLNTSIIDHDSPNTLTSGQPLETLRIPDVTLMQWMIQCNFPRRN